VRIILDAPPRIDLFTSTPKGLFARLLLAASRAPNARYGAAAASTEMAALAGFTLRTYVHTLPGAKREGAEAVAALVRAPAAR
jgi:hypothetical protein